MKRKIIVILTVIICFLLQSTIFKFLSFASISPNLLIIVTSSFGFMRGKKEGMVIFRKMFFPEDIKLPMILISASDVICNLFVYFFLFLFRRKFAFDYYLIHIIIPELVYTILVTIFLYFVLLKINQKLEMTEKRSTGKFV